jgi:glycosyltransferase involved in cell wall biosynthesis
MRVVFVNPTFLAKRPISEISSRMKEAGVETSVFLPRKLFSEMDCSLHHSNLLEKSKIVSYGAVNLPVSKTSEQPLPITPGFYIKAWKLLKENDVIHLWVPYYLSSLQIILMKKMFFPKKKLILTMDTVPGYSFSMGKKMDVLFKLYNKLFGWIIFNTPDIITLYGESLIPFALKAGMKKEKIRIISTGIEIKKKYTKIENPKVLILFAGLMIPRKGILQILLIAKALEKENIHFILAGDGPQKKEYERNAKIMELKNVTFLGWVKDMSSLYKTSDILILPAVGEGLPGVVMEAMSYGVPCIASDIPCLPDLIDSGKNGCLCNPNQIRDFICSTRGISNNKKLRKQLGINAFEKIKQYDWNKVIPKYKKLYEVNNVN